MRKLTFMLCFCMAFLCLFPMPGLAASAGNEGTDMEDAQQATSVNITVVLPEAVKTQEETVPDEPVIIRMFPVDVTEIREKGGRQIVKVYELNENEDPMDIPQGSFERGGWRYTLTDIIRRETVNAETKELVETVTIETETKEIEQILPLLTPTLEYKNEDGFYGILSLDVSSIAVETAGTKTSSYTMSITRQYPHLSSNDTSLIPKTAEDRGKTYTLASVDWQAQRVENVDYTDLPASYIAVAAYTATGSSTRVTGYITSAIYSGTVVKLAQGKTTYIAYFSGEEIIAPPEAEMAVQPPAIPDNTAAITIDAQESETPDEQDSSIEAGQTETPQEDSGNAKISKWLLIIPCTAAVAIVAIIVIRKKGAKATKHPAAMLLALTLCASIAAPALAADYNFESGTDSWGSFGTSTPYERNPVPDPMNGNTRRNKDAALFPPPFGVFSGDIPTDHTSPYHDNIPESGFVHIDQDLPPVGNEGYAPGSSNVGAGLLPPTSQVPGMDTVPWPYEDGSIGTLYIPKLKKAIKVYEGESLENMKKGIGHFSSTSAWDGNVGLAGHNRGAAAYFGFVKDLQVGDRLTFTTLYGMRTYEVFSKGRISETDFSSLRWTTENTLTLITCVENIPELRWCVQAREVR